MDQKELKIVGITKEDLTIKEHKRTFWGGGYVLCLDCGGGYILYAWSESELYTKKLFLLTMKYTSIDMIFKNSRHKCSSVT